MAQKEKVNCPVCGRLFTNTWYGRHLVKEHGWRYYDGIHAEPPREDEELANHE